MARERQVRQIINWRKIDRMLVDEAIKGYAEQANKIICEAAQIPHDEDLEAQMALYNFAIYTLGTGEKPGSHDNIPSVGGYILRVSLLSSEIGIEIHGEKCTWVTRPKLDMVVNIVKQVAEATGLKPHIRIYDPSENASINYELTVKQEQIENFYKS